MVISYSCVINRHFLVFLGGSYAEMQYLFYACFGKDLKSDELKTSDAGGSGEILCQIPCSILRMQPYLFCFFWFFLDFFFISCQY